MLIGSKLIPVFGHSSQEHWVGNPKGDAPKPKLKFHSLFTVLINEAMKVIHFTSG